MGRRNIESCYRHPTRLAVEQCEDCRRPVCGACLWYGEDGKRLCPDHAADALHAGQDVSPPERYAEGHVPGALNIPHRTLREDTTAGISKETVVITYCDGPGCNGSTKGALRFAALGFRVKEMIGGLEWWVKDGFKVEEGNGR